MLGRLDLTVVVVFYNMRREAARTLHSLTRAYQRGIEDLDYEVLGETNGMLMVTVSGTAVIVRGAP